MTEALLSMRDLTWVTNGRTILGPVDLDLGAGECWTVVGPNGAGKTTLLRLLTAVLKPTGGNLQWRGQGYTRFSRRELARRIAYVPQVRPARVPLTVEEVVLSGRYPHLSARRLAPAEDDWRAVRQAMAEVGVAALADRPLDQLSGGERQAAYIAAALAQEPELLVLDEPTTHLDPRHQREIAQLLVRLHRTGERTVVIATHDLNFASLLADRVMALRQGRVMASGPPARLLNPETLATLFEAPFETVRGGERPLHLLEIER